MREETSNQGLTGLRDPIQLSVVRMPGKGGL